MPDKHVMISYNWGNQELAKQIEEAISNSGFPTWMDINGGMEDDIMDSMAEAVEGASCMIALMSEKYNQSKNCSREFKYAEDKCVPIIPIMTEQFERTGWLALLTAGALYIEIKNSGELKSKKQELIDRVSRLTTVVATLPNKPAEEKKKAIQEYKLADKFIRTMTAAVLDVFMNIRNPGTGVIAFIGHGGESQRWNISLASDGSGYVSIQLLNTNLVLNITGYNPSDWKHDQGVIIWNKLESPNQLWKVKRHGPDADIKGLL